MKTKLTQINGIGMTYQKKLSFAGIESVEQLINECTGHQQIKDISGKSGIPESLVNRWVSTAGLLSIDGVDSDLIDLFHEAGVETIAQLANQNPKRLAKKMYFINEQENFICRSPMIRDLRQMVSQAQSFTQDLLN